MLLLPIRDENRTCWRTLVPLPLVNYSIIALNIYIFIYMARMPESEMERFINTYGLIPVDFFRSLSVPLAKIVIKLMPILTSMFLHGSWMHLLGNMLFLFIYGDNIECRLGRIGYLLFYLASGIVAALSHAIPFHNSGIPMVGASGAISGVLGAYLILFPHARIILLFWFLLFIRFIPVPAFIVLGLWFLMQVSSSLTPVHGFETVAWYAHVGGFVFGMLCAVLFFRVRR